MSKDADQRTPWHCRKDGHCPCPGMISHRCCFCGYDPMARHIEIKWDGSNRYVCTCGQYINRDNANPDIQRWFCEHKKCAGAEVRS